MSNKLSNGFHVLMPLEHDPFLMPDMQCAVDRLHHAVKHGERICCYGDYDVDGMSATSLYLLFLRERGGQMLDSIFLIDKRKGMD